MHADPLSPPPRAAGALRPLPVGAAALLLLCALLGTAAVRLGRISPLQQADAPVSQRLLLAVEDAADGSLRLIDAGSGRLLDTVAPGGQTFVRSSLRALVRERKRRGLAEPAPFELLGRADGRLTLVDPLTGGRIDLESFGPTNAAVFARLLAAR